MPVKPPPREPPMPLSEARRPYSPPTILHADELRFETELQCISIKTVPCAPIGCLTVRAS